jgi:16S rRNA G966 N2-methylase RsmD
MKNENNNMSRILLEGEALSRCAKSTSAVIDDEASFESVFDALQQLEEEEQARRAEQQGAGDLLRDAQGCRGCHA